MTKTGANLNENRLAGDALFDFTHGDVKRTLRDNMKCDIEEKLFEKNKRIDHPKRPTESDVLSIQK